MDKLVAGEVGYLAASIKAVADARVGDTLTLKKTPATEPLPGEPLNTFPAHARVEFHKKFRALIAWFLKRKCRLLKEVADHNLKEVADC